MAQVTISGHDKVTPTSGAIKLLRDYCGLGLKEAKTIVDECENGQTHRVDVPFVKRNTFIQELKKRGFNAV